MHYSIWDSMIASALADSSVEHLSCSVCSFFMCHACSVGSPPPWWGRDGHVDCASGHLPSHQEMSKVGEYACSVAPEASHQLTVTSLHCTSRSTGSSNQIQLAYFCKFWIVLSPCASWCLHPAITGAQDGLDHLQIALVVAWKLLGMLEWIVG